MSIQAKTFLRRVDLPAELAGELWLGPMPGLGRPLAQDLAGLKEPKIDKIICLAAKDEIAEKSPDYAAAQNVIATVCFPIDDFGVPQDERGLIELAREAATDLRHGQRLFIHCAAGIGRTGTVATIILTALGLNKDRASDLVSKAGSGPETSEQLELVSRLATRLLTTTKTERSAQMTCISQLQPGLKPPPRARKIAWTEVAILGAILACIIFLGRNVYTNMQAVGIQPGFSFLRQQAGFDLSESLIAYSASDTYLRAIIAGVLNTLQVAAASLVLASSIGLAVGLISVSLSPAARGLALAYVELFRNLPKILILLVTYVVAVNSLPTIRQAISLGPLLISNRGIYFPWFESDPLNIWSFALAAASVFFIGWRWKRYAANYQFRSGQQLPTWSVILLIAILIPFVIAWLLGAPHGLSWPQLQGFAIQGGGGLSTQFCAVAVSLGLYHGAQIAEVVRGGIKAIPKGQIEAAKAVGLTAGQTTRLVIVPQVLRMIVPPLNNQFVNLFKNTSISLAVGYSDLMSIAGTSINQTFRPLEIMLITMSIYLGFCLVLASALNAWSNHIRKREGLGKR